MAQKMSMMEMVQSEAEAAPSTRAPLYRSLGKALKRRIICFYTSFSGRSIISHPDAEILEEVIAHTEGPTPITLIVNSPGGDPVEAERIVRVCRKLSKDDFEVIAPRQAKSAATLICMGANRILMSPTSELGPVDPQVPWKTPTGLRLFPTKTLVDTYDALMLDGVNTKGNVEPFLQQLQSFNAGEVRQWRKYEDLTADLAVKLLACCQMKGISKSRILRQIAVFTKTEKTLDHSRPIFPEDAERAGLKVDIDCSATKTWGDVRELHTRCIHRMNQNVAKLCESGSRSMQVGE